jgi:ribosomal protein S8
MGSLYIFRGGKVMDYNDLDKPTQHLVYLGNKVYHAEGYIRDNERKKDIIRYAVKQLELYIEENKGDLEYIERISSPAERHQLRVNDALYFLNKIKECVKE